MRSNSRILFLDDLPEFAGRLARALVPGDVVRLTGEMGAGKTTFLYHVFQALGLPKDAPFSSPTFTILNQFEVGDLALNHADLYRLTSFSELESLDILPLFGAPGTLTFVEWGNKFHELKPYYTKFVHFEYVHSDNQERLVQFDGF